MAEAQEGQEVSVAGAQRVEAQLGLQSRGRVATPDSALPTEVELAAGMELTPGEGIPWSLSPVVVQRGLLA